MESGDLGFFSRARHCLIQTQVGEPLWLSNLSGQEVAGKKNNAHPTVMETEPGSVPFPRDWNPRSLIESVALKKLRQEARLGELRELREHAESKPQPGFALTQALFGPHALP